MIRLHQMLHGYKLGHNYIQGSIVLPSSHDMDKIATLSDWSEYVGIDTTRDYITAYPLDESPYYVVAKTWYADAMRRPGCVWTHSLLIQKEDFNNISDFNNLLPLFEAPMADNEDFGNYSIQLDFIEDSKESEPQLFQLGENRVADVYEKLLSKTPMFVLSEFTSLQNQELLLTLLNYVPVEILKNKSICSGTAAPRVYEGKYLSLQFVTYDGNAVQYMSNKPAAPWSLLVGISVTNNRPQLARLIRHYQDEIGDSIEKLKGFLNVIVLVNRTCKDEEEKRQVLLEIIDTLKTTFPTQKEGCLFKSAVFQPSLVRDFGGENNFLYTISTIDINSFTEEQIEYKKRLHELSTEEFLGLLKQLYATGNLNEWGEQTITDVAQYVSYAEIAGLRKTDKNLLLTIISNNTELLNQIVWSDFSKEELQSILAVFSDINVVNAFNCWGELFKIMFEYEVPITTELIRMAFLHDRSCIDVCLNYLNNYNQQIHLSLYKELKCYPEELLDWLSKETDISCKVADILINSLNEVSLLVKNRGSKIWMPLHKILTENSPIQYFIFEYRLSFNWSDQEALIYLRQSFYPIHRLLMQDKLDYRFWHMIEPYTESLFFLQNWDKCKRIRKMIVRRLKEAGHSEDDLVNYTPDEKTNDWLLKEWHNW